MVRFGEKNHKDALGWLKGFLGRGFEVMVAGFDVLQAAKEFVVFLKGALLEVFDGDGFWQFPGQDLGILLDKTGNTQTTQGNPNTRTKNLPVVNIKFVVDSLMDIDRHSVFRRVLIQRARRETCEYIWGFMSAGSGTPFWLLGEPDRNFFLENAVAERVN